MLDVDIIPPSMSPQESRQGGVLEVVRGLKATEVVSGFLPVLGA